LSQPAIRLQQVYTTYEGEKRPALRNINLTVEPGEFICIAGPNGAGKTTLLETILGCLKPVRGRVEVLGYDMAKDGVKARRRIGYVPQDFAVGVDEPYKALDVVLMGRFSLLGLFGKPSSLDMEKALEAMEMLGIENLAHRPVGKLSGGQQQKVMIARALAKEPEIFLLDEPLSNLDYDSRQAVSSLLSQINRERKATMLVVAHSPENLLQHCSRLLIISEGKLVADVRRAEVEDLEAAVQLRVGFK